MSEELQIIPQREKQCNVTTADNNFHPPAYRVADVGWRVQDGGYPHTIYMYAAVWQGNTIGAERRISKRFNSFNITTKQGVYFTVHSLGSIQINWK